MKTGINTRRFFRFFSIFALFIAIAATSCREKRTTVSGIFDPTKFDEDDFVALLTKQYGNISSEDTGWFKKKQHDNISRYQQHIYLSNQFYPLWLDEDGNTKYVEELIEDIENLQNDGLDPERYALSDIRRHLQYLKQTKNPVLDSITAFDTLCTHSYLQASHDLLFGAIPIKDADTLWYHANDSAWTIDTPLLAQLYKQGKYPGLDAYRSKLPAYAGLVKERKRYTDMVGNERLTAAKKALAGDSISADSVSQFIIRTELQGAGISSDDTSAVKQNLLAQYQQYYGLKPTGKMDTATRRLLARDPREVIDQVDINLERLRWLPQSFGDRYVLVNVPLMELFLENGGKETMHMRVIVGKPERQTPALNADMANIVFNPSWGVPPTILKKDVLPGVQKSGEAYLAKKDLVVYDHKGHKVDPSLVNASNYKKFVFRQPPGDDNALGYIKFNLPNRWDIYLHDTPHRDLFNQPDRAKSSGCVRVQQPREMAEYILKDLEGKDYDQGKIEQVIETQSTKQVNLDKKIPVHIVYLTVFSNDNEHVRYSKDIYHRDAKVLSLLKAKA